MKLKILQSSSGSRVLAAVAGAALLLPGCATQRDKYRLADTNDDRKVSQAEFEGYMLETIFAIADTDEDSKITFNEWKAANPDAQPKRFNAPDTNRDGSVTPAEAKAHFKRQGTLEDLFQQIDTDRDGYLSRQEVLAFKKDLDSKTETLLQQLSKKTSA